MKQPAFKGRPTLWRVLRIVALVLLVVLFLPYLITPLYAVIDPVSTSMLWRRLTGARVERQYVPIARISPSLSLAVIVAEDSALQEIIECQQWVRHDRNGSGQEVLAYENARVGVGVT